MRGKATAIVFSIFSLVLAEEANAGNAGAAFVGGMIGGVIGGAIANSQHRSKGSVRRSRPASQPKSAPSAPWIASPMPAGGMIATNGQGLTFTYDRAGNALLIVQPSTMIPAAAINSVVPATIVIDGKAFAVLQASVQSGGLMVDDPEVMALEQQLKPAHEVTITSTFASVTATLAGFTKSMQMLDIARQQQVILASSNPEKAQEVAEANVAASTTVVQVQVNGASAAQPVTPAVETVSATAQPQASTAAATEGDSLSNPDQENQRIGELQAEISILTKVLVEQRQEQEGAADAEQKETIEETIASIELRMKDLEAEFDAKNQKFENYLTSVKPTDRDLYLTARKASQVFPKVPYYIPGTKEQGEFWLEPEVTTVGDLMFNFRLIDPSAENETTRDLIEVNLDQLEDIRQALFKLPKNSKIAHDNKIRRNYSKRMTCFPAEQCPQERQNGEKGKASTEVIFLVYEDGSTAGRLQMNKGAFQDGVNFSIESSMLLQAYLVHVIKEAKIEYKSNSQSQKDLDQMFQ